MDWDEAKPRAVATIGENLANLSIAELEQRIAALDAEIVRVNAEMSRKRAHEAAATKLFKS